MKNQRDYAQEGFVIKDGKLIDYNGSDENVIIPDCVKVVGTHSLGFNVKRVFFPAGVEKLEPTPFTGSMNLEEIEVDKANPYYYSQDNCLVERATKKIVKGTRLSIIPQDGSVTAIAHFAFAYVDSARLCICKSITTVESCAFYDNAEVTLSIEAESKPEGWAEDWDDHQGETWDEVWWEAGEPYLLLEWGATFED